MADKKTPIVGEKFVMKLYGTTIQVLINKVKKVPGGFSFVATTKGGVTLRGKIDEYGNRGC